MEASSPGAPFGEGTETPSGSRSPLPPLPPPPMPVAGGPAGRPELEEGREGRGQPEVVLDRVGRGARHPPRGDRHLRVAREERRSRASSPTPPWSRTCATGAAPGGREEALRRRQVRREPGQVPAGPVAQPEQPGGAPVRADGGERRQDEEEEEQRKSQAAQLVEAARTAPDEGRNDEALAKAGRSSPVDGANADAIAIRDEATRKIAEAKVADEPQAEEREGQGGQAAKVKPTARPRPARPAPPAPAPAPASAAAAPRPPRPRPCGLSSTRRSRRDTSWSR